MLKKPLGVIPSPFVQEGLKSVQKLRALNFKIVAVSRASNRFMSFKYRWKADVKHFFKM